MTDKCKPGKVPTGKNGRCVKPRSTEKRCKPGKEPIGKNGRCVKPRSTEKKCKPGKEPIGKNGRCVKPRSTKKKCKPGKVPEGKNGRCVKPTQELMIRGQINKFMDDIDDHEFFTQTEIDRIVKISLKEDYDDLQIKEGLEQYSKSYGIFY